MIFTPNQIEELMNIIEKHHSIFITTNLGPDFLNQREKQILKSAGIDIDSWSKKNTKIDEAFSFGMLSIALSDSRVKKMKYEDFKKFVYSKNFLPLTTKEKAAIQHLKYQSFSDIKNLENKVKSDLNNIIIDKDKTFRTHFEEVTREAAIRTVEMRGSVKDMISEMGHRTGYWERDLGRIAEYTLHNAYEEGRAAQLEKEYGNEALVYKDVYPGACKHCIQHYLTEGIGSRPKVFKLSDLRANGSNVNKKVDDWLPTLGPLHPFCRCTVEEVPEGYVWSDDEKKFVKGKSKITNQKILNRKKILIKIGEEEYYV